uniref:Uncharacterized protein n=1 Tax=Candidatus Kentrum sp. TUN TaxID=2126343 RepID=A0A450ZGU8_9GAMM|nr:MAG: hypothetical protein BECKTUN1418D_GA0071000_101723 [Candidatus Kentron sp. TUN]
MLALRAKADRGVFLTGYRFFQNFYFSDTLKHGRTRREIKGHIIMERLARPAWNRCLGTAILDILVGDVGIPRIYPVQHPLCQQFTSVENHVQILDGSDVVDVYRVRRHVFSSGFLKRRLGWRKPKRNYEFYRVRARFGPGSKGNAFVKRGYHQQ